VKAKIVAAPEDYRWSSARAWLGGEPCGISLALDSLPFEADPAQLHRAVLEYQGSSLLDGVKGLAELLKTNAASRQDLDDLLREHGLPDLDCGTAAAG
jgi:hypothetical protein